MMGANNKNKYNPQEQALAFAFNSLSANNKNKYNPQERGNHYAEVRIVQIIRINTILKNSRCF